jgi:hypothetical protein
MDPQLDATRIGGRKAALACLVMFLFFEVLVFFIGSHGDLIHEGRNFVLSQANPLATSVVAVAFVTVFLLGRVAGKQILVAGRNHMLVALINWSITMGVLIVYVLGFLWVLRIDSDDDWVTLFLMLGLIMGSVWLLAVRAIKRSSATPPGSHP